MSSWRPIASAPKDGTAFLAYRPGSRGYVARQDVCIVHWSGWGGGVWETQSGLGKLSDHEVTHWMPLPECPSQETSADDCMAKVRQHFDERRAADDICPTTGLLHQDERHCIYCHIGNLAQNRSPEHE